MGLELYPTSSYNQSITYLKATNSFQSIHYQIYFKFTPKQLNKFDKITYTICITK
jgi:hypothetical protein